MNQITIQNRGVDISYIIQSNRKVTWAYMRMYSGSCKQKLNTKSSTEAERLE